MKDYKVISPYRLRDEAGKPLPDYAEVDAVVSLDKDEAERLVNAKCVVEVATRTAPENRKRGRRSDSKARKRVNN